MVHEEPLPEADALEKAESEEPVLEQAGFHAGLEVKPEADALEQSQPVGGVRTRIVPPADREVPEADWLEQSVLEPLDDEEPR